MTPLLAVPANQRSPHSQLDDVLDGIVANRSELKVCKNVN